MPIEVCNKLNEAVVSRALFIEDGAFVSKFGDFYHRKGSVIFVCKSKVSKIWLENEVKDLDFKQDLKVQVNKSEELKVIKSSD